MAIKIFVNLPVRNLAQSIEFFDRLGFSFNPQFTDETATCMIVGEDIFVMLLTEAKFKTFTPNPICDARRHTEVLVCLELDSRERVDDMVHKAIAAGGNTYNEPQDHGFMYGHGFQDLDGHIWELICMEPNALQQGSPAQTGEIAMSAEKGAVTVVWDTWLKPGAEAEGLRLTRQVWFEMRSFEGYLSHRILIDQDAPGHIIALARWKSRVDAERVRERYRDSETIRQLTPLLARPRERWVTWEDERLEGRPSP
jgi:predicted lactoylglutathione lyase/quinol monooxygenase YgiN